MLLIDRQLSHVFRIIYLLCFRILWIFSNYCVLAIIFSFLSLHPQIYASFSSTLVTSCRLSIHLVYPIGDCQKHFFAFHYFDEWIFCSPIHLYFVFGDSEKHFITFYDFGKHMEAQIQSFLYLRRNYDKLAMPFFIAVNLPFYLFESFKRFLSSRR